ncbi:MAG: bacillithiol transferase BstA [Anaerolineae bacterium]
MLTDDDRYFMIEKIRMLPGQLEALISGLTDHQLHTPFIEGEWTVAQNIHHLADTHMHAYIRMKLIATQDHPTLVAYDQNVWAEQIDAAALPVEVSLLLIEGLHARWTAWMDNLRPEDWTRAGHHPEAGEITLETILRIYSGHGEAHIDQMRRTLAAGGWTPPEDEGGAP